MILITSRSSSINSQLALFAMGYWWLGGESNIFHPPHKEYYLMFGTEPGRIWYCLPQFLKTHTTR